MFKEHVTLATNEREQPVPENDYTGVSTDEDGPVLDLDLLYDQDADTYDVIIERDDENEVVLSVAEAVDGAGTLHEAAERLYAFADELLELSSGNWEIVDDFRNGTATAVNYETSADDYE